MQTGFRFLVTILLFFSIWAFLRLFLVRLCPSLLSNVVLEGKKSLSEALSLVTDDQESSLSFSGFLSALLGYLLFSSFLLWRCSLSLWPSFCLIYLRWSCFFCSVDEWSGMSRISSALPMSHTCLHICSVRETVIVSVVSPPAWSYRAPADF
eukprot:IDg2494t1